MRKEKTLKKIYKELVESEIEKSDSPPPPEVEKQPKMLEKSNEVVEYFCWNEYCRHKWKDIRRNEPYFCPKCKTHKITFRVK